MLAAFMTLVRAPLARPANMHGFKFISDIGRVIYRKIQLTGESSVKNGVLPPLSRTPH